MLILRTRDGVPALDALADAAGRPVDSVARIVIEIGPNGARARIERRGAKKSDTETIEAEVTRLAAWFVPEERGPAPGAEPVPPQTET